MMARSSSATHGHVDAFQSAIDGLHRELNLDTSLEDTLDSAIRNDDGALVRATMSSMEGAPSIASKRLAISIGKPDMLRILLEVDKEINDSVMETALERKDHESLSVLLDFGWGIDTRVGLDLSPLDFAVDDLSFMQFLIQRGANVNARSRLDESPLSTAIARGNMDVVRFLIDQGTDLAHGNLLHCAAERVNQFEGADLVAELAKKGASISAYRFHNPTAYRWRGLRKLPTALHIASANGNILVGEALLRHGADPHQLMLQAGRLTRPSALDLALEENNSILVDLFTGRLAPENGTAA